MNQERYYALMAANGAPYSGIYPDEVDKSIASEATVVAKNETMVLLGFTNKKSKKKHSM